MSIVNRNRSIEVDGSARTSAEESKNTRDFFRVAEWSTAIGFGGVGGAVASLGTTSDQGFSFQITTASYVAFALGAALSVLCWALMKRGNAGKKAALFIFIVAGFVAFLSPLRFLHRDRMNDVLIGLTIAAIVLSTGGFLIWQVVRALSAEEKRHEGS